MSTSRSRSRSKSPEDKDYTRVVSGLKAATHNPRVSEEVKQRDRQILQELGENPEERKGRRGGRVTEQMRRERWGLPGIRRENAAGISGGGREGRQEEGLGGAAPERMEQDRPVTRRRAAAEGIRGGLPPEADNVVLLPTEGATYEESENTYDEPLGDVPIVSNGEIAGSDPANMLRGYKATLRNPRVSQEAKRKAEQVLREHGQL
ncbi:hypothetical protein LshimejAT787_0310940 [Lyophyllum shimeji]|uniref:Uncharacterized protein n=1 Tax=Lyophyllum shimeji TaxID=47721 RepID=A0A9P3UKX3_LYOSH|nr:hypothetical protein LshimejAT787_0310940 [Lyophyllum shimeji]